MERLEEIARLYWSLYPDMAVNLALALVLGVIVVAYLITSTLIRKRSKRNQMKVAVFLIKREAEMGKRLRKEIRSRLADAIVDAFEEAVGEYEVTAGEIGVSRDVANKMYEAIAQQMGWWDLVGRRVPSSAPPHSEDVKAAIKARLPKEVLEKFYKKKGEPTAQIPNELERTLIAA